MAARRVRLVIRASLILAMCVLPAKALAGGAEDVCTDTVVMGKVVHAAYEGSVDNWNGSWKLDIEIGRVVRGVEPRRHIVARAISEAQIKGGADFMFFLSAGRDGDYGVLSADPDLKRAMAELTRCSDAPRQ